ncbi:MAG TPA: hypothetical protein DCZ04_02465 [Syntrophorhabdus aromaticivorans]|nr:hypothetical protein [Syntrophorhabdus aromaticivorans]
MRFLKKGHAEGKRACSADRWRKCSGHFSKAGLKTWGFLMPGFGRGVTGDDTERSVDDRFCVLPGNAGPSQARTSTFKKAGSIPAQTGTGEVPPSVRILSSQRGRHGLRTLPARLRASRARIETLEMKGQKDAAMIKLRPEKIPAEVKKTLTGIFRQCI